MIDNTLSWEGHKDKIVSRLNQVCYKIRAVKPFLSQDILKMIYYAYFHSVMTYGLLFWGNSSHGMEVFGLQKKIIRIMMGSRSRDFCREFFKTVGILPFTAHYIYTITMFIVNNWKYFTENSELRDIKTRKTRTYFNHNKTHLSIKRVLIMLASSCIIIFLLE